MKKTPASPSCFANPRVFIISLLCSMGVLLTLLAFAVYSAAPALAQGAKENRQDREAHLLAPANVPVLEASVSQETSSAPAVSIVPLGESGEIDMARLGIHPLPAPLAFGSGAITPRQPQSAAVGKGKAFLSLSPDIVNQSTANAFVVLAANFTPGESVQLYLNGVLAATATADGSGRLFFNFSTTAGFGYITLDLIGTTSGNETGGVVQVAANGPYLPGFAAAPHAINTTAAGTIYLAGAGYPPSSTVTIYRNGASIGTISTSVNGTFAVSITPVNSGNTSAIYSADSAGADAVTNGGFETAGFPPWLRDDINPDPAIALSPAHSGSFSAHVGSLPGAETPGNSSFYQTITVPARGGTLSYWYWPRTIDTITFDWQDAYVTDTSGTILATIMHVCLNTQAWTNVTFDMAPYAGQTVRIKFLVHGDNSADPTDMYIDDVSLSLAAGSRAGQTIEERSDAGTPPAGDHNSARAFLDRATLSSATGGTITLVGEGFAAGENVALSGSAATTLIADANGAAIALITFSPASGVGSFTLTGATTGRVAFASVLLNANVTNRRSMIVAPALVAPGGSVAVIADGLPPSDTGHVYLDNVDQGTAMTGSSGLGFFFLTKPTTGFVHQVGWITSTGIAESTVLLLGPLPAFCTSFFENFDGVTAPALPSGWVATNASGPAPPWVTSTTTPDTAPNAAFVDDPATISDKRLDTPPIAISSASTQVSFRNSYNMEGAGAFYYDGGVLEVSSPNINGGAFTDITNAMVGGTFVSGGYNGTINSGLGNPLGGRMGWGQNSSGYINTVANLGPNVAGQTIILRFRMGSDSSVSAPGWSIDTLGITTTDCPPALVSAVSRKNHGVPGTFDVNLPLAGPVGIECRSGGATNDHQVVFTFASAVTFTSATVSAGTGTVSGSGGSGTATVTVNLTGVTNAQRIMVTLLAVSDGVNTGTLNIPMGVLLGDTNGNGSVSASDIAQTKANSGQVVSAANFRADVNVNGSINGSDVALVKSKSGTVLP